MQMDEQTYEHGRKEGRDMEEESEEWVDVVSEECNGTCERSQQNRQTDRQ